MGGSTDSQTTTQTTEPWAQQKPYLQRGFAEAQRQLRSDKPEYFPGSTVVPFSQETEQALGGYTDLATDPGSMVNRASAQLSPTMEGAYLQPGNPVFQGMLEGVTGAVRPGFDSRFSGAHQYGSPLHQESLARGVTQGMLPFIESERGRQEAAIRDAPSVAGAAPGILSQVGGAREAKSGQELQEEMDRFNFEQNIEAQKLREYMANITGNFGGTTTATQPLYSNPLMQGLGMASSLAGIGSAAYGAPGGGGFMTGK